MFTERYKQYFLHGYLDCEYVQVQRPDRRILGGYKSLHAAKMAVTRDLKAHPDA